MLLLTKQDIQQVFRMNDAIAAYEQAFRIFSAGGSVVPLRTNIGVPKYQGQMLFMPGYVPELDSAGVKIVSVFPQNSERGKLSVPATMVLVDATTGEVNGILDGTYVTQLRTGAATGAATKALARADARLGALIGTGGQAAMQLAAMLAVRNFVEIRICGQDYARTCAFATRLQAEWSLDKTLLRPVRTAAEAIEDADVITTVTTSRQPVFDGRAVKAGAHINAIGSYMPSMQEVDAWTVTRAAKIFCESKAAALAEAGDFIVPIRQGLLTETAITGDIGQLFSGELLGRENEQEITLFKSVGLAVVDIVTAEAIYQRAKAQGIGVAFEFGTDG